jgi:hypothetical protein
MADMMQDRDTASEVRSFVGSLIQIIVQLSHSVPRSGFISKVKTVIPDSIVVPLPQPDEAEPVRTAGMAE